MQTYAVDRTGQTITAVLFEEGQKPLEIHVDDSHEEIRTGDIFIGRVMQVAWNIRAAFVDIGYDRNCYLPIDDSITPVFTRKGSSEKIQQGDELIVQVERPAMKTKAPALNAALTVRGRYLLLGTKHYEAGVSRKVSEPRRSELRRLAEEMLTSLQNSHNEERNILIRTNASSASDAQILQEFTVLADKLRNLIQRAPYLTVGSRLLDGGAPWLAQLLDLREDTLDKILIEDEAMYLEAEEFLHLYHPELSGRLVRYIDPLWPLASKYGFSDVLAEASHRRVWLRSGAYLVIEPTEALTSIDVNSGKIGPGKRKNSREETFLKVNLEAAAEIARQLRLRSISGIIIVDFINLEEELSRKQLLDYFQKLLAADPVPSRVVDMTRLGLVEVTRKKTRRVIAFEENR